MLKPARPSVDTALKKSGRGYTFPNGVLVPFRKKYLRKQILSVSLGVLAVPVLALGLAAPQCLTWLKSAFDISVLVTDSGYIVDWC